MIGNPALERSCLERTYEDTASFLRAEPIVGIDAITRTVPTLVYSDIICALSQSGGDRSSQGKASNTIEYDALIFVSPELSIRTGDTVELKRFGRSETSSKIILSFVVVGRPSIYSTHMEVRVKERGLA